MVTKRTSAKKAKVEKVNQKKVEKKHWFLGVDPGSVEEDDEQGREVPKKDSVPIEVFVRVEDSKSWCIEGSVEHVLESSMQRLWEGEPFFVRVRDVAPRRGKRSTKRGVARSKKRKGE